VSTFLQLAFGRVLEMRKNQSIITVHVERIIKSKNPTRAFKMTKKRCRCLFKTSFRDKNKIVQFR